MRNRIPVFDIVIFFMAVKAAQGETCVMEDASDTKYPNTATAATGYPKSVDFATCKSECIANGDCVAVHWKAPFCYLYTETSTEVSDAGYSFSKKVCTADTCDMTQTANADGDNDVTSVTLSSYEDCERACASLEQCVDIVYGSGSNTCHLFTSAVTTSASAGDTYGKKTTCSTSGKDCCFKQTADLGTTDPPWASLTSSLESCEQLCQVLDNCQAVSFSSGTCKIFIQEAESTPSSGTTLSVKSCPSGSSISSGVEVTLVCLDGAVVKPITALVWFLSVSLIVFHNWG